MSEPNLNELERRLAGWRPATEGLDADAMLFAAGRASVQRGAMRFAWPVVAACLGLALSVSTIRNATERRDFEKIVARLTRESSPVLPAPRNVSSSPSYLIARRAMERDPDGLPLSFAAGGAASAAQDIPRAGQRNFEIDH